MVQVCSHYLVSGSDFETNLDCVSPMPNHRTCLVNACYIFLVVSFSQSQVELVFTSYIQNMHLMNTFCACNSVPRTAHPWQTMKKKLLSLLEFELIASLFLLLFYRVMLYTHPTFAPVRLPSGRSLTSLLLCITRWLLVFQTSTDCFRLINQHIPRLQVPLNLSLSLVK